MKSLNNPRVQNNPLFNPRITLPACFTAVYETAISKQGGWGDFTCFWKNGRYGRNWGVGSHFEGSWICHDSWGQKNTTDENKLGNKLTPAKCTSLPRRCVCKTPLLQRKDNMRPPTGRANFKLFNKLLPCFFMVLSHFIFCLPTSLNGTTHDSHGRRRRRDVCSQHGSLSNLGPPTEPSGSLPPYRPLKSNACCLPVWVLVFISVLQVDDKCAQETVSWLLTGVVTGLGLGSLLLCW